METSRKRELQIIANHVRQGVIEGTYHAKSGHPGGSLSIAETLTYLYYEVMRNDPRNPKWEQRDRLVLSKGHCCPALYAVLAERGYFPKEELQNLRHIGAHDFDSLDAAFAAAQAVQGKPSVIIQKSIKGKGVSYMEDVADWHGKAPNAAQYEQAMQELNAALAALEG